MGWGLMKIENSNHYPSGHDLQKLFDTTVIRTPILMPITLDAELVVWKSTFQAIVFRWNFYLL